MLEILQYPFAQRALLAGLLVALTCSTMGLFLVLRRLSMVADALGHITFGSIAAALLLGLQPLLTAIAGALAGATGLWAMRKSRLSGDTAMAILFSTGLAAGVVMVSAAKSMRNDVMGYLFGSLLTISEADLLLAGGLCVFVLLVLYLLFKEWVFLTFDPAGAQVSGLPVQAFELGFLLLTALAVVVSVKVVGVLLVTSLMVVPAAAAIQLRLNFKRTLLAANLIALLSTLIGFYFSYTYDLAAGGTIVLCSIGFFLLASVLGAWARN